MLVLAGACFFRCLTEHAASQGTKLSEEAQTFVDPEHAFSLLGDFRADSVPVSHRFSSSSTVTATGVFSMERTPAGTDTVARAYI